MKLSTGYRAVLSALCLLAISQPLRAQPLKVDDYVLSAGHVSLSEWLLPAVPEPENNPMTAARVSLGEALFFDPRLSESGKISCATCHAEKLGWSDGVAFGSGHGNSTLSRRTPTIINAGYVSLLMWDGRFSSLEEQALGPISSSVEMNMDLEKLDYLLRDAERYKSMFGKAYPNEEIDRKTISKALASFERTLVSNDSRFDRWVNGEKNALSEQEIHGFAVFLSEERGNCVVCHHPPNFTDDGFHNLGIGSSSTNPSDEGRYEFVPIRSMHGAFKTPTLRDVAKHPPYFHDGSAIDLEAVIEHYQQGGTPGPYLSPNMKPLTLSKEERAALIAFMYALNDSNPAKFQRFDQADISN